MLKEFFHSDVILDNELNPTEKLVFCVIAKHANVKTKSCQVYLKTIAEEMSRSVRTVQRSLKKLSEKNYIVIEPCFSITGKQLSSKYTVV